jgi:50S ribosomal subunit-associated GTPase HflX
MPSAEQHRKKRVSFNEQVLARIYRSNSSIIATKNKQDRKIRNRMRRRAESESSDQQPISVEELIRIPTIPLAKLSAEEKIDESAPNCDDDQDSIQINERRDSGFDSGMDSAPE